MAFLIQENEGIDPAVLPLGRSVLLVGRDTDSNLYLEASEISKNHASIFASDDGYLLKDNGSTNGTIINGQKVSEHRLAHGDKIQFGPYLFRVDLKGAVPARAATMERTEVRHSGNSYTNLIKLNEIKGAEKSGALQVVVAAKEPPVSPEPVADLPCEGLLADMSLEDRRALAGMGAVRKANAGTTLISQGSELHELILILSGSLEARLDRSAQPLGRIAPGDWIGELNVFDPSGAGCSVVALTDSTYWSISRSNLEGFLSSNHRAGTQLLVGLANTLGKRLRQSLEGANQVKKARPVLPWMITAAAAGVAILAVAGYFNERQNAGFRLAEMSSILSEREKALGSAEAQVAKLKSVLEKREQMVENERPPHRDATRQREVAQVSKENHASAPAKPPQPQPATPPKSAPQHQAVTPAKSAPVPPVPGGVTFPPEIIVTKKTQIPLETDGVTTGSLTLSEGVELFVLGEEGRDVFVEIGGASKTIPKNHTNFTEALTAYLANPPAAETTPKPSPTPKEIQAAKADHKLSTPISGEQKAAGPATLEDLSHIVEMVDLLHVLEEVQNLKGGSKAAITRFVRIQDSKWQKAAESATQVLGRGEAPQEYKDWLTKVIEASQMFNTVRFPMLEKQLRELDNAWVTMQARSLATQN